ncbi:532a4f0a-1109-4624-a15c-f97d2112c595 [Sclerotinia trifoliorum]|uniref:Nucleolar protein 16 n=1 Tax=Sclerotinia trifoliorum TaxID=28548 RepID=A0A8H2ZLK5_9HELO|nr:532a4f0a-1109-4624-a15c-f97d2112c595 [Sclerotinia trifoliorum]
MGRELQKKKNRSGNSKIKLKPKSKRVNPLGNAIIAANWRQDETLTQNYRRLGLTSRLNTVTGGIEKKKAGPESKTSTASKLAISNTIPKSLAPTEARVERDPETGKIIRVIHDEKKTNPLNDPLDSDAEDEEGEGFGGFVDEEGSASKNEIVKMLEEQASRAGEKRERQQSEREKEWIGRLVKRWGENYGAMVRDRRLNPMQQTESDIKRRVQKWKDAGGSVITEA